MALFLYFTFAPSSFGLRLKKFLYAKSTEINTLYTPTSNPYARFGTHDFFYMSKNLNLIEGKSFDEVSKDQKEFWFGTSIYKEIKMLLDKKECEYKIASYPKFLLNFKKLWKEKTKSWAIFKCYSKIYNN
jgi:hypothetical protein